MAENSGWYDRLYADDPSTDNIFGREELRTRPCPSLHVFLAAGGRLGDHVPRPDPAGQQRLAARIKSLIAPLHKEKP